MRFVLRTLGIWLLLLAMVAAVVDATGIGAAGFVAAAYRSATVTGPCAVSCTRRAAVISATRRSAVVAAA